MKNNEKVRVLMVCDSLGHSTGYYVVSKGLREAGIEVILGGAQTPSQIVESAVQEDADFIGYRIMDGAPEILVPMLVTLLKEKSIADIPIILGGIIAPPVIPKLKAIGIKAIFTPGTKISEIAACIIDHCNERGL